MRLARHYFFTKDFGRFDALWPQIPVKYGLAPDAVNSYNGLDMVYALVRPHLQTEGTIKGMSENLLDSLSYWSDWCSSPGFLSRSLLRRNGTVVEMDCSGTGNNAQQMPIHHGAMAETDSAVPLDIYPNPANNVLTVSFQRKAASSGTVGVYIICTAI